MKLYHFARDSCGARSREAESLPSSSGWTRGLIRDPEAVVPDAKRDFTTSPNEEDAPGGRESRARSRERERERNLESDRSDPNKEDDHKCDQDRNQVPQSSP